MIDPQVEKLTEEFNQAVIKLNAIWADLHKHNVWVRADIKGSNSYDETKQLVVSEIRQTVTYYKTGK